MVTVTRARLVMCVFIEIVSPAEMKTLCTAILAGIVSLWATSHFAKGAFRVDTRYFRMCYGLETGSVFLNVIIHKELPLTVPEFALAYSRNLDLNLNPSEVVSAEPRVPTLFQTIQGHQNWFYNSNPFSARIYLALPFWIISVTAVALSLSWIRSPRT